VKKLQACRLNFDQAIFHPTWSFITHTASQGSPTGVTSSTFNSTGGTFVIVAIAPDSGGSGITVTDNKGNTYTALTKYSSAVPCVQLWYCANATVGAGHTVTVGGSNIYSGISVMVFNDSGSNATPADVDNGTNASSTNPLTAPTTTPSVINCLVITAWGVWETGGAANTHSINSGYTLVDDTTFLAGNSYAIGFAYKIQTSIVATAPSWTDSGSINFSALAIASFKP